MLSQAEADVLISSLKKLTNSEHIVEFPQPGKKLLLECEDGNNNKYTIDVNRGRLKPQKSTYQTRHNKSTILLRVDIEGPPHVNPNGEEIPCPHIHIYKEGYDDKWAYPLQTEINTNTLDLIQVLIDFLDYNNVKNRKKLNILGGDLIDGID